MHHIFKLIKWDYETLHADVPTHRYVIFIFKASVNKWMSNSLLRITLQRKMGFICVSFATSKRYSLRAWICFWLCGMWTFFLIEHLGDFSSTKQPYGKLIRLFFQVPCWQRKSIYLLHSSFLISSLSSYLCVCVLVRWLLGFPLGAKKSKQETSGGVISTCCALYSMFSHSYIFPQTTFKPNQ